jgi:hypothetical protein
VLDDEDLVAAISGSDLRRARLAWRRALVPGRAVRLALWWCDGAFYTLQTRLRARRRGDKPARIIDENARRAPVGHGELRDLGT